MISRTLTGWGRLLGLGRPQPPEKERRLWDRTACDVETVCRPTARGREGGGVPARVQNVSTGGACLHLAAALQPGELFSLRLPGGPADELAEVLACAVRCDSLGGDSAWEVGCSFASPLSAHDLTRFD